MGELKCYGCNIITNVDKAGYSSFESNFCICWECNGNTNSTDCERCEEEMNENQLKFLLDIYGDVDLCLTCSIKENYEFKNNARFILEKNIIDDIYNKGVFINNNIEIENDILKNVNEKKYHQNKENANLEELNNNTHNNDNIISNLEINKKDYFSKKKGLENDEEVQTINSDKKTKTEFDNTNKDEIKQEIKLEHIVNNLNNNIVDEDLPRKDKKQISVNDIFIEIKENKNVNININYNNEIFNNIKNISTKRIEKYKLMIELYEKLKLLKIDKPIKFKKYLEENNADDCIFIPIESKSRRMFDKCKKLYIINNYIKIETLLCLKNIDKIFTLKNKEFDELIHLLSIK